MNKRGFTLTELMIALTVMGIICVTVLPAIVRTAPAKNKIMMKQAYYTTTTLVSDLINNPNLYPQVDSEGNMKVGFDNTEEVEYAGETYGGAATNDGNGAYAKFIGLFSAHLNKDGEIDTTCPSSSSEEEAVPDDSTWQYCRIFTSPNGMKWSLYSVYTTASGENTNTIVVDVNGNKEPNCMQGDDSANQECKDREEDFDRFSMEIKDDGTVTIPEEQTWAREAIQVSSSITK